MKRITSHKRFTSTHNAVGALITHEHKDHSLSMRELFKAGIRVFSYANTEPKKKYCAGNYTIMPFLLPHDGVKNYGFIIHDKAENKRLVYATDTTELPMIAGVDIWLVECNYTTELWEKNVAKSDNLSYYGRILDSHMSLEKLVEYFNKAAVSRPMAIILCHLSENGNADKDAMTAAMAPYADMVDVASKGNEWLV
jgi:ribonuclease BN (tRNA processing enzyme)